MYCGVGDNDFSLSLILQDGIIKGSCGFMAGVPQYKSPPYQIWQP